MLKQKNYLAIGAVVVVAILILSLPTRATERLKLVIGSWFLPLFGLSSAAQHLPADLANSALPRRELLREIDRLRNENQQLRSQAVQAVAIVRENDQLRTLLNWQRQVPWKLKLANVIMRDPANWWRTAEIDLGTRDGIRKDLPIITDAGLVGRVSSVSLTRSEIVLIGDPNCRVSATVEDATRDMGVVVPSGPVDTSLVQLTYLPSSANLKPGQVVVTSGLGGVFPKGIPIGQILDSRSIQYGVYTEARVKLSANLGSLEQVWVLFP
ncbi:MAG TPA: rod shape-determining protein MreC [Candidatus Binatia bacterium]|nr:rod shape-determining protein MreC [Candidatus Binatia bacterium]